MDRRTPWSDYLEAAGAGRVILVTGSTGLIGSEVLRRLSQTGVPARALTRDLKKARQMPGVTWVGGDLGKPETLPAAFEGTKTLFLLTHYLEDMVELQHNAIADHQVATRVAPHLGISVSRQANE